MFLDIKKILLYKTTNISIQFIRYIFVGGIAALVDIGLVFLFTSYFKIYYLFSVVIGFIGGIIVNYILSSVWVFGKISKKHHIDITIFLIIGLIGLFLNILIIYLLVEYLSIYYLYAKVISTFIVLFWNFLARKFIIFDKIN